MHLCMMSIFPHVCVVFCSLPSVGATTAGGVLGSRRHLVSKLGLMDGSRRPNSQEHTESTLGKGNLDQAPASNKVDSETVLAVAQDHVIPPFHLDQTSQMFSLLATSCTPPETASRTSQHASTPAHELQRFGDFCSLLMYRK
ncbi:hypothetical protein QBC36DRAFT_69728 [Triangularia setosa]|uniref:Secreted protein n=1 Tax=Triangularia setosa TaxID=2587417 RepID=A0AAN6VZQ1_9PEZI|nr:hypothetical protein QBC36DRAFT_69728 [Podospora setosa]